MPNSAEATPLSHGQLYSWREVESYPPGWEAQANLSSTWDLRGLGAEPTAAALRRLVELHEPLRTWYEVRDDGVPHQHVDPLQVDEESGLPFPIVQTDRQITDFADPHRTTTALAEQAIPATGGPCWRAELVSTDGVPMFMSLSFSHLILDVWSTIELERQFRILVEDPEAAIDVGPTQRDLAGSHQDPAWQTRQAGAEKHWRGVLAATPEHFRSALPTLAVGETAPRIQATLHSSHLTTLAAQAASQHSATVPAVLLALVTAGLAEHLGTEQVTIGLMSSNRFAPEHRRAVGTLNQLVPIVLPVDQGLSLAEHVKKTHWASARAYRYACYDLDRITEAHGCSFNELFPAWFNYLPFDDVTGADDEPAELVWMPVARQYGQPFDVRVTAQGGRTSVALRTDPKVIDAAALVSILRGVAVGTSRAVSEPESCLKDLWGEEEPQASLFPRSDVPDAPQ